MKKWLAAIAAAIAVACVIVPAAAQWQTPQYSVPVGRGAGVTGFNSAAPGSSGQCLVSNGASANPTFQACPGGGGGGTTVYIPAGFASTDIQTSVTAACAAGGGVVALDDGDYTWASGASTVTINCDNVWLVGSAETRLLAPSDATNINLITVAGSFGTSTTLGTSATLYAKQLILTSAANISVGDYVEIEMTQASTSYVWFMITRVTAKVSNTITLNDPMPFVMTTGDTTSIRRITLRENVRLLNLRFVGNGNSGASTRGCLCQNMLRSHLGNIFVSAFRNASGIYYDRGYMNSYDEIKLYDSGDSAESDITIRAQTGMVGGSIVSEFASGFGPQIDYAAYSSFNTLISLKASSRGVKLAGVVETSFGTIIGNNSDSTGVAISLGSQRNTFGRISARGNTGSAVGNRVGVWFSDQDNDNNIIGLVQATGNTDNDVFFGTSDNDNDITTSKFDTITDNGTGNSYSRVGTWTPVLTFATPGNLAVTYTTQSGTYTRKGRLIILAFQIATSSFTHTTASGNLQVTGLPFTPAVQNTQGSLRWAGITQGAAHTQINANILTGPNRVEFRAFGSGQSSLAIDTTDVPTGGTVNLFVTLIYEM